MPRSKRLQFLFRDLGVYGVSTSLNTLVAPSAQSAPKPFSLGLIKLLLLRRYFRVLRKAALAHSNPEVRVSRRFINFSSFQSMGISRAYPVRSRPHRHIASQLM